MVLGYLLLIISFAALIPYSIVFCLTFILWKFSFTAKVNGFFSFSEIMIRIPLHLNFSILIRIERLSLAFTLTSRILKVQIYGFQLNILVRDDFKLWYSKKIELLQMLEDLRTSMKRKGLLQSINQGINQLSELIDNSSANNNMAQNLNGKQKRERTDLSPKEQQQLLQNLDSNQIKMQKQGSSSGAGIHQEKAFMERMLHKLLSSFEVELIEGAINFYVYQDEDKRIEEQNIKRFYINNLMEQYFNRKFLCFRVFIPKAHAHIHQMTDDEADLLIQSDTILLQNPKLPNKQGMLKNARINVKIPLDKKLAKDFCNFDLRITIQRGTLNLSIKFIKAITKFLVSMDTLKEIIKRIKRLITKLHFQDELLKEMERYNFDMSDIQYENFKDEDIPKRLKINIEEGLTLILQEPAGQLMPFLSNGSDQFRQYEQVILNTSQIQFELLRTLRNSYYINTSISKLTVECNQKESIIANNFTHEMDFSFQKQIQESILKSSKMEMNLNMIIDSIDVNLAMSEVKLIQDIIDIYLKMVYKASVKNSILDILLEKEFLKSNLLHLGTSQEDLAKEKNVLQLFKEQKYKDTMIFEMQFKRIGRLYQTYDPINAIKIDANNFKFKIKDDKGIEDMNLSLDFCNVQPIKPNTISMLKLQAVNCSIITSRGNQNIVKNISVNYDKCHINLNMEHILSMTREILDLSLISKSFTRKWDVKYVIKQQIKKSIIESLGIQFQETQFIWNMSKSRYLAFRLVDFKAKPITCPFKIEEKLGMCYVTKEFSIFHSKTTHQGYIPGKFYCIPYHDKDVDLVIESQDFEIKMIFNEKESKIKIVCGNVDFNLPEKLHFGAIIHEIVKQIAVSKKWFSSQYIKLKHKYSFQLAKLAPKKVHSSQTQNYDLAVKGRSKSLFINVEVKEGSLKADESKLKKIFMNKDEIVDILKEREIYKCKQPFVYKMLKRLKQSQLNDKAMTFYLKNFKMFYEIPTGLLEFMSVFKEVQNLDEARDSMTAALFKELDPGIHTYKCDYLAWHIRNLHKPFVEVWGVDFKFLFINAQLNPDSNPSLFKTKTFSKIFKKFDIVHSFNKLVSKQYYDADVKLAKIKMQIQGQQTFLFMNDLGDIFKRFGFDDLSSTRDFRCQKLSYYSGIDLIRNRMHGKAKIMIQAIEAYVQPKRKHSRFDQVMKVSLQDFFYCQQHTYQESYIRNLIASKYPLASYESAFLKIPQIEMQMNQIYNQGKTINHFTHFGVQTIGQYLDQLKSYSSQEVELDCKLNIPSLGHRNDTEKESNLIQNLMNAYFEKSPIPIFHYQRSHMKFFDQLANEYFKKADYTSAVEKRRERGMRPPIQSKRQHMFKIKIKTFINDIMGMFSDFRENLNVGTYPETVLNDRNLALYRDKFLKIYKGIIFNMENLSFKSQILVKRAKDGTNIELINSGIQSNFMRLSYLNNNNLFSIRHKSFKIYRDKQFEHSFDNYKFFCQFFEFNPLTSPSYLELSTNSVLKDFKTLFPGIILNNIDLQQEIMIATLNPYNFNPFIDMDLSATQEDFVFSVTDTIGTLVMIGYQQDKEISFYHTSSQKMEEKYQQARDKNPLLMDLPNEKTNEEKFTVKHMFSVKGIRFLYTQQTIELITHHLVKSFDYKRLRKTDFIDIEQAKEISKDFGSDEKRGKVKTRFSGYDINQSQYKQEERQSINLNSLKKVALIGLRLEDPQINFQNDFTKSQMLLTTIKPTTAVIFGYIKSSPNLATQHANSYLTSDDLTRQQSGYNIGFHEELIRKELKIQVDEMDIFVAPTIINLENPTFWISNLGQVNLNLSFTDREKKNSDRDRDSFHYENILRKIITVNNISFTFDFLNEEFVDGENPWMLIDILVEKIDSEMNGPNMWHFVYVLKSILFDRGFKTEEILLNEKLRLEELSNMKLDIIKRLIDHGLKRGSTNIGNQSCARIGKKIKYTIMNGDFKLINFDQLFAEVVVDKVIGTHLIYTNKESKVDIDIDRIVIDNFADTEQYRNVLFPGFAPNPKKSDNINQNLIPETMIKVRARDKYIVVREAPWRVYDQFEVFIFPTSLQLTKNFYKQIKSFFFADMPDLKNNDKQLEEAKKYELLVPTKALKKAQEKTRSNKNDDEIDQPKAIGFMDFKARLQMLRGGDKKKSIIDDDDELNISDMFDDEDRKERKRKQKKKEQESTNHQSQSNHQFPIFFRYMRMNEIGVSITYFHKKNSFFNSKDLKIKIDPFIRHGKFVTFKRIFEKYEHHCKKNFISQIPSLLKQRFLQTKENFKGGKTVEDIDDDFEEQQEMKKEIKLANARKILFGEFYTQ